VKANWTWFLLLVAVVLAGCNSKPAENGPTESESVSVSLFNEGQGVLFSEETKALFDLEVAEVMERPMQRRVQKTAQVYRPASEAGLACATVLLLADEGKGLNTGQSVSVKTAGDGPEIEGRLVRLDAQAQVVFGKVEGLIEFADPEQRCLMGEVVTVTFANGPSKAVSTVLRSALLTTADGNYVYAVNGTHLTRTRVKAGAIDGGFVAIEDGLYAGDAVAVKGVEGLWLVELSALKGGTPCCPVPMKKQER